jgi:short-subunit dehydrogenase
MGDLEAKRFFVASTVYSTTKLENILFTSELGRRLEGTRVLATCFNPGIVATDFGRDDLAGTVHRSPLRRLMKSPESGADTLTWLVTEPADRLRQGGYYSNRRRGILNAQALSHRLARELWEHSAALVGVPG